MQRVALLAAVTLAAALPVDGFAQAAAPRAYNTVMEKLARGEPVIGGTIHTANPDTYCAVANAGFDFNWIEMQHSSRTYSEVEDSGRCAARAGACPLVVEKLSHPDMDDFSEGAERPI